MMLFFAGFALGSAMTTFTVLAAHASLYSIVNRVSIWQAIRQGMTLRVSVSAPDPQTSTPEESK